MIKVLPYEAEHGLEIIKNIVELHNNTKDEMIEAAYSNKENSQASYTLFLDDEPIVAGGVQISHKGVGNVWLTISKKAVKSPKLVVKTIKKHIRELMEELKLNRLQTPILCDFSTGLRFASALGFKCETPDGMKYYGYRGETYKLFSLIRED